MSWNQVVTEQSPSKRSSMAFFVHNNLLYIWGGMGGRKLDDLWCFDPAGPSWTEINTTGTKPERRGKIWASVRRDHVYIFAGWTTKGKLNDLHRLDLRNFRWEEIEQRNPPPIRSSHSTFVVGNHLYLWAGIGAQKYNDMYRYSFRNKSWVGLNQMNPPGKRSSYYGFHLWRGEYYLYAGLGSGRFGDMHALNLERREWRKIRYEGTVKNIPIGRGRHSVVLYRDHLWSYGGWVNGGRSNELWKFSLVDRTWAKVRPRGKGPGKLEAHVGVLFGPVMYIFAGWKKEGVVMNTMYSINLDEILDN